MSVKCFYRDSKFYIHLDLGENFEVPRSGVLSKASEAERRPYEGSAPGVLGVWVPMKKGHTMGWCRRNFGLPCLPALLIPQSRFARPSRELYTDEVIKAIRMLERSPDGRPKHKCGHQDDSRSNYV
jgi:hypothetical protein